MKKRSESLEPPFVYFIDRCLGKGVVPQGLEGCLLPGEQIKIHDEFYPPTTTDVTWLTAVGKRRWVVLSQDQNITRNPLEQRALLARFDDVRDAADPAQVRRAGRAEEGCVFPCVGGRGRTLLMALLAASCDLGDQLQDTSASLFDPDPSLLRIPGEQLATGQFHSLEVVALDDGEARFLVLEGEPESKSSRLRAFFYPTGESCDAGRATSFDVVAIDPPIVAAHDDVDGDGFGEMRFFDFDCQRVMPPVVAAEAEVPPISGEHSLVVDRERRLHLIDEEKRSHEVLAKDVTDWGVLHGAELFWTIEGGLLALRELDEPEAVVRYAGGNGAPIVRFERAFLQGWLGAFESAAGVFGLTTAMFVRRLSNEGCEVRVSPATAAFQFFSPCAERRIVIQRPIDDGMVDWYRAVGPSRAVPDRAMPPFLEDTIDDGYALVLVENEASGQQDLVRMNVSVSPGEPLAAEEVDDLGVVEREAEWEVIEQGVHLDGGVLLTEWDGTVGTLVEVQSVGNYWVPEVDLIPLARRVADYTRQGTVLADFDGEVGNLFELGKDGDGIGEEPIARDVPLQRIAQSPGGESLYPVGDFDGTTGTVYEADHPLLEDAEPPRRLEGASGALPGSVEYLSYLEAVAYRTPTDEGQRLSVYFIASAFRVDLPYEVSDYSEVARPFVGLVYLVPRGEEAGIWIARAR